MKYSVQEMYQALKDGKIIFFQVPDEVTKYEARLCPNPDLVVTSWTDKSGSYNDIVYKLTRFINNFDNGWICTKIEGEETMGKNTPHKHAELIKLWADTGCQIQYKYASCETWHDCSNNRPCWEPDNEYRVKPTIVKKWKWVILNNHAEHSVTHSLYSSPDDFFKGNPFSGHLSQVIQKVDSTMQEVEE